MSNTKIKAGQFYGVIGNGTNGYFLVSDGNGGMSWISNIVNPTITNVDYPGTATAADPAGGESITLTGTGFKTGATVTIGGTAAPSVSYVSATQLTITTPAKTAGDYDIVVTNTDTGSATYVNGISYNGIPAWTTAAGSLGTFASGATISTITLQASEPDAGTITFNITNGALPTGLSLTGANIDGTTSILNADTLYTFTVTATDDENQATPRTFTITVQKQFISSENFTINTYTGNGSTQSIEGKIGTAASFNGSSSGIVATNFPITGNAARSYGAWVYMTGNVLGAVCGTGLHGTAGQSMTLWLDEAQSRWSMYGYSATYDAEFRTVAAIGNLSNGWHHFGLTWDASSLFKLYINGTLVDTATKSVTYNTPGNFFIGRWAYSTGYWINTKIDQVRVFNKELSSSEVTTLYGENNASLTKSTTDIFADGSGVALYEFEKGAKDTGGVSGYIGNSSAVFVNPTGSKIGHSISVGADFSVSFWINISSYANTYYQNTTGDIIGFGADSGNGIWISTYNGKFSLLRGSTIGGQAISTNTNVPVNTWAHVVISYSNGNTTSFYVNGSAAGTYSHTTTTTNTGVGILSYIGDSDYPTKSVKSSFTGKIDQVRIFNKAISSSEVTTLYGETTASATKSTTDIFGDSSGVALYELEGNANDTGGTYNGTPTNVSYAYDGTPTNVSFVGTSFEPGLVWIKRRSSTEDHAWFDSIRGIQKQISSNLITAEYTTTNAVSSFDSNGFTTGNNGATNSLNQTYVSWMWKAGGAAVSGTSSHYTNCEISANPDAGFSIVKFTIPGGSIPTTASYNHGLNAAPKLIITKPYNGYYGDSNWHSWAEPITTANYLNLNTTAAAAAAAIFSSVDSSTVRYRFGSNNGGADSDVITYNFTDIEGYQKVGSYTGNGSTNGPIITTGFRPRFILAKPTSVADNWTIWDNIRDTGDNIDQILVPSNNSAESANGFGRYDITLSSTGFQIKQTDGQINGSGQTYIYLAIA